MMPQQRIIVADPDLGEDPPLIAPAPVTETRRRIADSEAQDEETRDDGITELTDEERTLFNTLLTVGRRNKTISVMGHTVAITNLTTDDDLRVGLFCKDFLGAPPAEQRAYQLAVCAAGVRSIDGTDLVTPLRQLTDDELYAEKVAALRRYYPVVITQIYGEILKLDAEFYELAQKLGKADG